MAAIHNEIENYLAADLHNELSEEERNALHAHLVECAACRQLQQENKVMDTILGNILAVEKADSTFEQRMLAGFRTRLPRRSGRIAKFMVNVMRLRATQITAVAAVLLLLIGVGWLRTLEPTYSFLGNREAMLNEIELREGRLPKLPNAEERLRHLPPNIAQASAVDNGATRKAKENVPVTASAKVASLAGLPAPAADAAAIDLVPNEGAATDVDTTESNIPTANENTQSPASALPNTNRKLIRNAEVELEVVNFEDSAAKITAFANEDHGYVVTSKSEKQANGKLSGEIVVKVLPENLDKFLRRLPGLGEVKNQTLGSEDITKAYFDTDSRLRNARVMEQRLIEMLKTKTGKVSDLLAVEKELGRVREEIEKMQGDLKYWDSQVQFSTVTITLAEKDLEEAAAFLLKEQAQLSLYAPDVEKTYNDIKLLASAKIQITNAEMDRDNSGRISARINLLVAPEESDGAIARIKGMARVENFKTETERTAQGGSGMSANAKTKRDKVELNVTLSRDEQEQAYQQTNLRIQTSAVDEKAKQLRVLTEKQEGRVRSLSFSRDPDGREFADASLRVPMKNYAALMQSLRTLGKVQNISVARSERTGMQMDEANAPADLTIQVYSGGYIATDDGGIIAILRQTIRQGAEALMWSLRMVGVALAFFLPWIIALIAVLWLTKKIRARRSRKLP